jgi:hypothetical protein
VINIVYLLISIGKVLVEEAHGLKVLKEKIPELLELLWI